ncbi:MAG: hypothetical protein B6D63_04890 [Candidatus Latescibacteria bacterium 4484_7]|nr:MAG: hypothetical protein B6D63_04890 [Candidatus Latescibacteria bacterium 4484_7]
MNIDIEKNLLLEDVEDLFNNSPIVTFFHTPLWLDALTQAFERFEGQWITVLDGGNIKGVMPVIKAAKGLLYSCWSMPFATYGGPVALDAETERALLDEFFKMAESTLCFKAQTFLNRSSLEFETPSGVVSSVFHYHVVDLSSGFDDYWSGSIRSKRKQLYRKSLREGIEPRMLEDTGELESFYSIYLENSRSWGGVHPYPFELFSRLFEHNGRSVLFLGGYKGDQMLGANVVFYFKDSAQAWQAAMTEESYDFHLSEVLIIEGIREACKRGIRSYNLGASNRNEGIMEFKESMGGVEHTGLSLSGKKGLLKRMFNR